MPNKDSYCSFCGAPFETADGYPKNCESCHQTTYRNPLPVAVVLLPVGHELLVIRRNIPPVGELALPGGFIEAGESWQAACQRELFEETGIEITAEKIKLFDVASAPDGTVLIFGLAESLTKDRIKFTRNDETQEIAYLDSPVELEFPLHTKVVKEYFDGLGSTGHSNE